MLGGKHSTGLPGAAVPAGRDPASSRQQEDVPGLRGQSKPPQLAGILSARPRQAPFPVPAAGEGFLSVLPGLFPPLLGWNSLGDAQTCRSCSPTRVGLR